MNKSCEFIAFGELLCRLDCVGHRRLVQSQQLDMAFTGGEANIAVALALWGHNTAAVSAVPENELGDACINFLRRFGLTTTHIVRGKHRLGVFFVEPGAGQRGPNVIYDRLETSFRHLQPGDLKWEEILNRDSWMHFTGTALVSPTTRALLLQGLQFAQEIGATISFDVSYRSQLWTIDEARSAFHEAIEFVDVFFGSESDAQTFFGIDLTGDVVMSSLHEKLNLQAVAFTDRHIDEQGVNHYSGRLFDGKHLYKSVPTSTIAVDRIGTGDAFAAGIIHYLMQGEATQAAVNFATAAAVLKHTIPGDFALLSFEEVERLQHGEDVGKVRR